MFRVVRDLFRHDSRFRVSAIFLAIVLTLALMSFLSPYDPRRTFQVPADMPPSPEYPFGTNSRGQDLLWWMTFALRNSLYLGIVTALVSRAIAIVVGLTAGYRGGAIDRVLMSINDTFVVIPLLPILILLSFLLRGRMSLVLLALVLGAFGWPWDARLIRSQVLSLKERSFTRTAIYSGNGWLCIIMNELLPFVLPVVFATTIANMLWSIGMEVTLSVLGLSDLSLATIGTSIYWANQHQALVAGIWWWLAVPIVIAIALFLGLFLLFTSINEYLDPRTRLRMMGA